ncbi:unnamed protein product [Arabidopsis halleri]
MAAPPPPQTHERAFGVSNIKSHIPLILDLDDHNYNAWRELFMTHCLTFDVLGHLDGTLLPANTNDAAWHKRDGLVKLWIYGTLAPPLFRSSFETGGTARDVWLRVENQFRNNKEARAIQLDNELRTQQIGDRTIQEYCQKIKPLADLLSNDNERNLVMYLLNGLNEKFDSIINVIKHKDPFPTFAVAKSMLEMEESRLKKSQRFSATRTDRASSSTSLTVAATSPPTPRPSNQQQTFNNNRGNNNHHQHTTQPAKSNNFRGNRKNNVRYIGRNDFQFGSPNFPYWAPPNMWSGPVSPWPNQFANWTPYSQMGTYRPLAASRPMNPNSQQAHLTEIQPTSFTEAYTTDTLPVIYGAPWIMDSGSTAHLSATEDVFLKRNLTHFARPHIFVLCNADDKFRSSMSLVRSLSLRLKDPMAVNFSGITFSRLIQIILDPRYHLWIDLLQIILNNSPNLGMLHIHPVSNNTISQYPYGTPHMYKLVLDSTS